MFAYGRQEGALHTPHWERWSEFNIPVDIHLCWSVFHAFCFCLILTDSSDIFLFFLLSFLHNYLYERFGRFFCIGGLGRIVITLGPKAQMICEPFF